METIISHSLNDSQTATVLCRICLQNVGIATKIFSAQSDSKEILHKIYTCFQIILSQDDCLPDAICSNCTEELNMANKFRLKCVTFEERFKAYCTLKSKVHQINENTEDNEDSSEQYNNQFELYSDTHESEHFHPNKNQSEFKEELFTNNTKNNFENKCDLCNKVLKTRASLLKHIISMHEKRKHIGKVTGTGVNRRYHCTKCLYITAHSQTLVNHMRTHDGERPYHCHCGKSFTQSSSLAAHGKTHSDSMYFTCSTCGKQFKHAFTLKKHLRVHESGTFTCRVCNKSLKSQQSLQEHLDRHYNIRNFNCEDCGATFVSCSDLLNHKKNHSTKKKAECHLCGYKTFAKKNLKMHLKRHTGDKAFKCDVCDVTMYTCSDLRRHHRVHTREKPFACPTCAQRFSHSPSLNKHVRNVHGMQYKWGDCKSVPRNTPIKNVKI